MSYFIGGEEVRQRSMNSFMEFPSHKRSRKIQRSNTSSYVEALCQLWREDRKNNENNTISAFIICLQRIASQNSSSYYYYERHHSVTTMPPPPSMPQQHDANIPSLLPSPPLPCVAANPSRNYMHAVSISIPKLHARHQHIHPKITCTPSASSLVSPMPNALLVA